MTDVTPQMRASRRTAEQIAHERAMTARAIALQDADLTPEFRAARAVVVAMQRWIRLLSLAEGWPALAQAAEGHLEDVQGDCDRAMARARTFDAPELARARQRELDRRRARRAAERAARAAAAGEDT